MEAEKASDFSDYFNVVRRRAGLVLGIFLPIGLGALVLSVALPSVYRSSAIFELKRGSNEENTTNTYADQYVSSLTDSVLAPDRIKALPTSALPPLESSEDLNESLAKLKAGAKWAMVTQKVLDPASGLERPINTGFLVSFDDRDPVRAEKVALWLADAYVAVGRLERVRQASKEAQFYAAEADRIRARISAAESSLAAFKQKNFDQLPEAAQANLNVKNQLEQELTATQRDISTYQQNRVFVMQQLQQTRAQNGDADTLRQLEEEYQKKLAVYDANYPDMVAMRRQIDSLRRGDSAGAGTSLQAQLNTQRSILAETRLRYSEDHPDVKKLERTIKSLEARLASGEQSNGTAPAVRTPAVLQLETQLNANNTQVAALQQHAVELRTKLEGLQGRLSSTPEVEREYETLTRDAGTAHAQYDQMINKRMQAEVVASEISGGTADRFALLAKPVIPSSASSPKRLGIAGIGLIAGALLALMAAIGATSVDPSMRGSRDVMDLLKVSPIGIVPVIRNAAFHKRRMRQLTLVLSGVVVGVPMLFLLTRIVFH